MTDKLSVSKNLKKENVYSYLRDAIITGKIPANTPLIERDLCEVLNSSRTPVREALQLLVTDSLVTNIPNKGHYVSSIHYEDIVQIYDVRDYLERLAGRLATDFLTKEQIENLKSYINQMDESIKNNDTEKYYAIDTKYHFEIVNGSRNQYLKKEYYSIYPQIQRITHLITTLPTDLFASNKDHLKILDAIMAHNKNAVEENIKYHIQYCKNLYLKFYL